VSLQVECVVKTFPTECAEVSLHVAVAFHVSVQESLEGESFAADPAPKLAGVLVTSLWYELLWLRSGGVKGQRIFYSMASIDEF
jgi:hypothetical protein